MKLPTTGLEAHYDAALGVSISGSGVSQWLDRSGNGHHLTQGTDAARPAQIMVAGAASISFASGENLVIPASLTVDTQSVTLYVVAQFRFYETSQGEMMLRFSGGGNANFWTTNNGNEANKLKFKNRQSSLRMLSSLATYWVAAGASSCVIGVGSEHEAFGAANAATTSTGGYVGTLDGTNHNMRANIHEILVYSQAHNDRQRGQVFAYLEAKHKGTARRERKLAVIEGDSITAGGSAPFEDWPAQWCRLHRTQPAMLKVAKAGRLVDDMQANAVTRIDNELAARSYQRELAVLWGGSNDINQVVATAATVQADIASWVAGRKTAGIHTIVLTTLPRVDFDAGEETMRQAVNSWILSGGSGADTVVDVNTDARLADPNDAAYFADGVHLTAAGYAIIAAKVKTATDAFWRQSRKSLAGEWNTGPALSGEWRTTAKLDGEWRTTEEIAAEMAI